MIIINKIIKLTKIINNFYWLVFLYFFASYKCIAKITTEDVCIIVKESIEEQANLEYLAPYRELIFITPRKSFNQDTGKFLFLTYKTELQKIKENIKGNYTTQESIADIPVGPETLQAKYVLYDIISQHDITKLNYIEGYQQLHSLLASGYKTAKKLIDAPPRFRCVSCNVRL